MKIFHWQGLDKNSKKLSGMLSAHNTRFAQAELIQQNISITKIKRINLLFLLRNRITVTDINLFIRQFSTLIKANIPILSALHILAESQQKLTFKKILGELQEIIQSGHSLSHAFKDYPKYFNYLLCELIYAGEQSGTLDIMLERIANYREKMQGLSNTITKALLYPTVVIIIAALVSSILLLFVVPQFAHLFADFGVPLPTLTRIILNTTTLCKKFWWIIIPNIILLLLMIFSYRKHLKYKEFFDKHLLQLPIFGSILQKSILARCGRTLATTFSAGIPLLESLDCVAKVANNQTYFQAFQQIKITVSEGKSLSQSLQNNSLFPNLFIKMLAIGEEAGSFDTMLNKLADFYESEVDDIVKNLSQLLEPIVMLVLGVIIGSLVFAMYMPIFRIGSVI